MEKPTSEKLEEEFERMEAIAIELPGTTPPARRVYDFKMMTQYRQHHTHNAMGEGVWKTVASKDIRRVQVLNEPPFLQR